MPWQNVADSLDVAEVSQKEKDEVIEAFKRKAKARFYADENFPTRAIEVLREFGAKVVTCDESGLRGRGDEDHIAFARDHGLMLVTCDRDYLNNARFPLNQCPAIFVFEFGTRSDAEIRAAFRCLSSPLSGPKFYDKWIKVDASRDGWIEHAQFRDGSSTRVRFRVHKRQLQEWVEE